MRSTPLRLQVRKAFADSSEPLTAADLKKQLKKSSGTIQPIIKIFLKAGWIEPVQQMVDLSKVRGPVRRPYRMTEKGREDYRTDMKVRKNLKCSILQ